MEEIKEVDLMREFLLYGRDADEAVSFLDFHLPLPDMDNKDKDKEVVELQEDRNVLRWLCKAATSYVIQLSIMIADNDSSESS
jgi:hypothetical protein